MRVGTLARLVLLSTGLFLVGTNAFVIAGILPSIAVALQVSTEQAAYSISFYALVVAVAAPLGLTLLSRLPRLALLVGGLTLICLGTAVSAVALDIVTFTVARMTAALGGAVFVPTAVATAAAMAGERWRARAIATVTIGSSVALAVGAPVGTAIAGAGGWRVPIALLACLAAAAALAVALSMRSLPPSVPASWRNLLGVLVDRERVVALTTTTLVVVGFDMVYLFSATYTQRATGGSPSQLSLLLLGFGVASVVCVPFVGAALDRFGSRRVALVLFGGHFAALIALTVVGSELVPMFLLFVVLGATSHAALIPAQHRLVEIDRYTSAVSLSWFSTALYLGIGLVPLVGGATIQVWGLQALPLVGASAMALAAAVFPFSWRRRRDAPPASR